MWYNPMTDEYTPADVSAEGLHIALRSGESRVLITTADGKKKFEVEPTKLNVQTAKAVTDAAPVTYDLTSNKWALSFTEDAPAVGETYELNGLKTWESLSEKAGKMMGTGVYETTFKLSSKDMKKQWTIDLGDVRESARVYINDKYVGCAWAVPYILDCKDALQKGKNTLRIEVTNLPANRIAALDRQGVKWRKMKEINVVDINYKKTTYEGWDLVPSGLNSHVKLVEK